MQRDLDRPHLVGRERQRAAGEILPHGARRTSSRTPLRTAAQHNKVSVGVYAAVERGGTVRRGDAVGVD
jgi:hypothetical protein